MLFMPVLLVVLALLAGLGHAMHVRQIAAIAADMGALAGVQCLDLAQLASGHLVLAPEGARAAAQEYVAKNLPGATPVVEVTILNPATGSGLDPLTGRVHAYATVCVVVRVWAHFRLGPVSWQQEIVAHADASVVPR